MKSVRRFVLWSILCCIAMFVVTAAVPAVAASVPAARLEGDAIEPEVVEPSQPSTGELPKMDFVPAQIEEPAKPVIEEPAPVKTANAPTVRNEKISSRIREYWLKIHAENESAANDMAAAPDTSNVIAASENGAPKETVASVIESHTEGTIVRQIPVEQKPAVEKSQPAVEETKPVVEREATPVETKSVSEEPTPVVEESEQRVEKPISAGGRALSDKVRECWLKIHSQDEPIQTAAGTVMKEPVAVGEPEPSKGQIVRQVPVKEKTDTPDAAIETSPVEPKIEVAKDETFAPAPTVTSPPLSQAPVVFQKKSAKLALFSGPLAKMAQRREYRLAEAKRLNIVLPSQGGSFDKLPQSIAKLKTAVEDILTRNGPGMVLSMIFKGHFAGGSANQKRTNK